MPIKTIFLPLNDADGASVSLGAALSLANTFGAAVDVVHLRADPTESLGDFVGESVSPQLVEEVLTQAEKRSKDIAAKTRKAFDAAKGKSAGVTATYREEQGNADLAIETQGRISDLIVVRRPRNARDAATWVTAEVALMGTGRPVLVLPLDSAGQVDVDAWRADKKRCTVQRFWGEEEPENGFLVHTRHRTWAFSYAPGEEDDEPFFRFEDHAFKEGEYVSLTGHDGEVHPFPVVSVA